MSLVFIAKPKTQKTARLFQAVIAHLEEEVEIVDKENRVVLPLEKTEAGKRLLAPIKANETSLPSGGLLTENTRYPLCIQLTNGRWTPVKLRK